MCVAVAANVLFLRAPVLGTYVRASPCSLLISLDRPLLGQAPNPESGLTVVFSARCGLTSSRAYVLGGGCSALARVRSAVLRCSVGSLGGSPLKPPFVVLRSFFVRAAGSRPRVLMCLVAGAPLWCWVVSAWGLSSRPAALRSAAFALKRARSRPRPTAAAAAAFPAVGRSFQPCLVNKCLLLSGALPPLTPARGARAGARCFSWYLTAFGRVPVSTAKAYRSCASIR